MPFTISSFPVKLTSSFKHRHYFSKIGKGKSYCPVIKELRKENGYKDMFFPISERTNSFVEDELLLRYG